MTLQADQLEEAAERLIALAAARGVMVATAESCTGGLIAAFLTEVPGSSAVLERGFVTYSNEAKHDLLGVEENLLRRVGAVSSEVAAAMAKGALEKSRAGVAVSVTGIAGPGGGTLEKPVGLVYLAAADKQGRLFEQRLDCGPQPRRQIRFASVAAAFELVRRSIENKPDAISPQAEDRP